MKESAMLALEYIKAHASILDLNEDIFDNWNIHILSPKVLFRKMDRRQVLLWLLL